MAKILVLYMIVLCCIVWLLSLQCWLW